MGWYEGVCRLNYTDLSVFLYVLLVYEAAFLVENKDMSAIEIRHYYPYYEKKHRLKSIYSLTYYILTRLLPNSFNLLVFLSFHRLIENKIRN